MTRISISIPTVPLSDKAQMERENKLKSAARGRFGKKAITYGILLGDLKMPDDGRHSVKMPGMMYQ